MSACNHTQNQAIGIDVAHRETKTPRHEKSLGFAKCQGAELASRSQAGLNGGDQLFLLSQFQQLRLQL